MPKRTKQFSQFLGARSGVRRRPSHVTIGTHQHSGGGDLTDGLSGGEVELACNIGHCRCDGGALGEIDEYWPPIAG
ncbi:hypothetical protein H7H80_24120 [Mycobacterium interjectum]|nr:hypothetical protein [Mycobacterium interjectum]MCV7092463.1 hypothetical protein [Mycobacterium interjectum]